MTERIRVGFPSVLVAGIANALQLFDGWAMQAANPLPHKRRSHYGETAFCALRTGSVLCCQQSALILHCASRTRPRKIIPGGASPCVASRSPPASFKVGNNDTASRRRVPDSALY